VSDLPSYQPTKLEIAPEPIKLSDEELAAYYRTIPPLAPRPSSWIPVLVENLCIGDHVPFSAAAAEVFRVSHARVLDVRIDWEHREVTVRTDVFTMAWKIGDRATIERRTQAAP